MRVQTEAELVIELHPRFPNVIRFIEVPGETLIILSGTVRENLHYLVGLDELARIRQNRDCHVKFQF